MKRAILLVALCAMGVAGCLPDDLPAYVNNGRTIVVVTREDGREPNSLWTVDVATKAVKRHSPGKNHALETVKVLDGEVLACWGPTDKEGYLVQRLDHAKGTFVDGPAQLGGKDNKVAGLTAICQEGRKLAILGSQAFSLPGFARVSAPRPKVVGPRHVGNGWWVEYGGGEGCKVHDPNGKLTATISQNELDKTECDASEHNYLRIGESGKAMLLASGSGFAVFDTESGAMIWTGAVKSERGNPLVSRKEVWAIGRLWKQTPPAGNAQPATTKPARGAAQPPARLEAVTLMRYTPPAQVDGQVKAEVVLQYPADGESRIGDYAPAPDGSHFLVVLDGKQPKLLFVPIRRDVTAKDVGVVELKEKS